MAGDFSCKNKRGCLHFDCYVFSFYISIVLTLEGNKQFIETRWRSVGTSEQILIKRNILCLSTNGIAHQGSCRNLF